MFLLYKLNYIYFSLIDDLYFGVLMYLITKSGLIFINNLHKILKIYLAFAYPAGWKKWQQWQHSSSNNDPSKLAYSQRCLFSVGKEFHRGRGKGRQCGLAWQMTGMWREGRGFAQNAHWPESWYQVTASHESLCGGGGEDCHLHIINGRFGDCMVTLM